MPERQPERPGRQRSHDWLVLRGLPARVRSSAARSLAAKAVLQPAERGRGYLPPLRWRVGVGGRTSRRRSPSPLAGEGRGGGFFEPPREVGSAQRKSLSHLAGESRGGGFFEP